MRGRPRFGGWGLLAFPQRRQAVPVRPAETVSGGELEHPQAPGPLGPSPEAGPWEVTGVRRFQSVGARPRLLSVVCTGPELTCLLLLSQMPGVTVKDVNQQEFVRALAAFLKK